MLQATLKFIKDKVLLVAFVVLGAVFIWREQTRPIEKPAIVQMLPAKTVIIDGKQNAQIADVMITPKAMKDSTKHDRKQLHAHQIESKTIIVDAIDTSKNRMQMPYDTISIRRYDTRKWLLAPLVHKVDIEHSDTSIHTVAGESMSIKEPKTLFVIGPYVGYDVLHSKPALGVSVTFNLFSIKSKR